MTEHEKELLEKYEKILSPLQHEAEKDGMFYVAVIGIARLQNEAGDYLIDNDTYFCIDNDTLEIAFNRIENLRNYRPDSEIAPHRN